MLGQPGGGRRRVGVLVARFREKGATSPSTAMAAQELGLPPRFERAMGRRLGATGVFVQVGGKYYLDEARLAQFEQHRASAGGRQEAWASRSRMLGLRLARMGVGIATVALVLLNIFVLQSIYARLLAVALLVLWIALTAFQFYYLSRRRGRLRAGAASPVSSLHSKR